jgi:hypothetical protein
MVARSRQKIFAASLHIFLNLVLNHYTVPLASFSVSKKSLNLIKFLGSFSWRIWGWVAPGSPPVCSKLSSLRVLNLDGFIFDGVFSQINFF